MMQTTGKARIWSVVRKEFRHIFRDKISRLLLFFMPGFVLILFGYALSFDVHHHNIQVYNPGHSVEGERLFARLEANPKFQIVGRLTDLSEIGDAFARANTRAVVVYRADGVDVFLDGTSDLLASNEDMMIRSVLADFFADESRQILPAAPSVRYVYNPSMKKEYMPVPGLVMMIFMLISSIVLGTSFNKEKAQGSYRMLRMTRMSTAELIAGKSLPYFLISLFHVMMVWLACLYFGVPVQGSLLLFFGLCILYSVCCMSLGLLIAAWFDRPLDVLVLCWIVLFIPNVFLSGFMFPINSMDEAVRPVVEFLPGTAFITAFRNIAYKGTGLPENYPFLLILTVETFLAFALSLIGFKRKVPR
jgi:ABC-2 type transport system permease protein